MRSTTLLLPLLLAASPVLAQAPAPAPTQAPAQPPAAAAPAAPGQAPAAQAPAAAADPVVARVDGTDIHRSDVMVAIAQLPPELRGAPEAMLFPLVLDQLVTQQALVSAARAQKLDQEPEVQARIRRAEEQELQQALLRREIAPLLTEEALRARYQRDIAGKPGEEEVHARHILVATEEEAKKVLEEVRRPGADFAAIARTRSTGPGTEQGGDLGFFKKGDMVPEFAEAAFALQAGQIGGPVHSAFGWHIIKVEERRTAAAPSFEESLEQLRQAAFEEGVNGAVTRITAAARVERFNPDGTPAPAAPPPSLLDGASPPAAQPNQRR